MSNISSINSSMNFAANALQVHATGMQVSAHNIANISTDGFKPQHAVYATGSHGKGVELQAVLRDSTSTGQQPQAQTAQDNIKAQGGIPTPSGTELAKELVSMISTQRAYEANAQTIQTADDMYGTLLSIRA